MRVYLYLSIPRKREMHARKILAKMPEDVVIVGSLAKRNDVEVFEAAQALGLPCLEVKRTREHVDRGVERFRGLLECVKSADAVCVVHTLGSREGWLVVEYAKAAGKRVAVYDHFLRRIPTSDPFMPVELEMLPVEPWVARVV